MNEENAICVQHLMINHKTMFTSWVLSVRDACWQTSCDNLCF